MWQKGPNKQGYGSAISPEHTHTYWFYRVDIWWRFHRNKGVLLQKNANKKSESLAWAWDWRSHFCLSAFPGTSYLL
jgi:hypothetical protein